MSKYKICVYAICKNEENFVGKWYNSMKEADEIYVLDTGSTDNTVNLLKEKNVNVVVKEIDPWRFDVARNESLDLVPNDTDICVCTDLDEVFNVGWRQELESVWDESTNRCRYIYNWSLDTDNNPKVSFYYEKIHSRHYYKWTHPVHEILQYDYNNAEEKVVTTDNIILNHYPDVSKSRSNYLSLLELSVKEDPEDDRNMHYLGREYLYHKKWNECIDTLIRHLKLSKATWKDERSASMRFIARAYQNLNRIDEAKLWLDNAIKEATNLRDPYVERALLEYNNNNWDDVKDYCLKALKIDRHEKTYINETFSWDSTIYDLLSLSEYYNNNYKDALNWINKAIEIDPKNERLNTNRKIIEDKLKTLD